MIGTAKEIFDITHPLNREMITWMDEDALSIDQYTSIGNGDYCNTSRITIDLHAGTHIDAPKHFIDNAGTVDSLGTDTLIGEAFVAETSAEKITAALLEDMGIPETKRLLFKTRNVDLHRKSSFISNFVALDLSAAEWIVERDIKLVGIDYLSVELPDSTGYPVHRKLLENGVVILENIRMEDVPEGRYNLIALPMKLEGVEASPVRAILMR